MTRATSEEKRTYTKGKQVASSVGIEGPLALVAHVLHLGVTDPDYFRGPCGRWWAGIGELDPEYLYNKAVRLQGRVPPKYKETHWCTCKRRKPAGLPVGGLE